MKITSTGLVSLSNVPIRPRADSAMQDGYRDKAQHDGQEMSPEIYE